MLGAARNAVLTLSLIAFLSAGCSVVPVREITPNEYVGHVQMLASDEMMGRGNGTPELDKAAQYIRREFQRARLHSLGRSGYFQYFTIRMGSRLGARNRLVFATGEGGKSLPLGTGFVPVSFGGESAVDAPVVFAGYGITAQEYGYDDYAGIDVNGKAVLIFDLEPQREREDSPFDGRVDSQHALLQTKILNARNNGAAAVIVFTGPLHRREGVPELPRTDAGFSVDGMGVNAVKAASVPIEEVLTGAGIEPEQAQKDIDDELKPRSSELTGVRVSLEVDVASVNRRVANVVGMIPGSDPKLKDEVIVVGAHYDHLGLGYRGSMAPAQAGEVHNGADDNASGVAALIEIAQALNLDLAEPRRTILFVAFAGEEMGALGSTSFVNNPPVPVEKIVAMLNMDMVGRPVDRNLLVGGVGTAEEFRRIVETVNRRYKMKLILDESGISSSDHTPFALKGIPVLFFFTGVHTDYHRPSDDWEKIDAAGGATVARFVADVIRMVDALDERPKFVEVKTQRLPEAGRGGPRPWFGSVPDFTYPGEGYRFQSVMPGSPAAEAGLQAGDVMIEFAGKNIGNIYDYTAALGALQAGDEVDVVVLRDGDRVTARVMLAERKE
jgi:hypothetical protein